MTTIQCLNPDCPSPTKTFEWDETQYVQKGGGVAMPHADGAKRIIAYCPRCGTENVIWVHRLKPNQIIFRGGKKREQ